LEVLIANQTSAGQKLERSLRMMFGLMKTKTQMMKTKTLLGVCAAGFAVTCQAVPFLTIDDFDDPAAGQSATVLNGVVGSTASSTALAPLALGGWRTIRVQVQAKIPGGNSSSVEANTFTSPGNFQFTTSSKVDSKGWVTWDANGVGLNANFSSGSAFVLSGVDDDLATPYTIILQTFGGGSSTATVTTLGNDATIDLAFPIASFTAGANLSDIDRITLLIDPPRGGDVSIDSLGLNRKVPESLNPGTALLGACGLLVLGRRFLV
jgi:hypothetical protein